MDLDERWRPQSTDEMFDHLLSMTDVYFWRGSGDSAWALDSTVVRRIRKSRVPRLRQPSERLMASRERVLLNRARHDGYGVRNGVRLTDLELLALLRHLGAATRLVDFSRSAMVALWFACSSHFEVDGELLGVSYEQVYGASEGSGLAMDSEDYDAVMTQLAESPAVWQWHPTKVGSRVSAQHSHFLFSTFVDEPHGTLALEPESTHVVEVPSALKKELLAVLQTVFDIHFLSMFPDVEGFAQAYGVEGGEHDRW